MTVIKIKKTYLITFFILAVFAAYWLVQITTDKAKGEGFNAQLTSLVEKEKHKYNLPALSVSIKLPGTDVIYNAIAGTTTMGGQEKNTPKTLFQMGSITKSLTAALVYQLDAENSLSINDTLGQWLPEYKQWRNITLYQLLTHTSGVAKYINSKGFWQKLKDHPNKQWGMSELTQLAYDQPLAFQPGDGYQYTNTDYVLLGMIIEKATYHSVAHNFQKYFFNNPKLNLSSTYDLPYSYPAPILARIAHGYDDEGTFGYNKDVTMVNASFTPTSGAIVSTPEDIVHWIHALFTKSILSEKQLGKMLSLVDEKTGKEIDEKKLLIKIEKAQQENKLFTDLGAGSGIGMVLLGNNDLLWMHAGGMPGYQSLFAYNPCTGMIIALAYNKQPQEDYVFMAILKDINAFLLQKKPVLKKDFVHNSDLPYQPACDRLSQ